jgi:hypothetical protein
MSSSGKDWMPTSHEGVYNLALLLVMYLDTTRLAVIGIAGEALMWYQNEFKTLYNEFVAAFEDWKNPAERTKNKIAVLKLAEKKFKKAYRELYTGYIKNNPLVTNVDLVDMGFPERHEGAGTPSKPPTEYVEPTIVLTGPAMVKIEYQVKGEAKRAKPKNCHGMETKSAILDNKPVDWSELTESVFSTASPLKLTFSGEQRGKVLFFACRWENNIGQKGPWSEIYSVIIP